MNPHHCPICRIVPRQFWLFGGTKFWFDIFHHRGTEKLCPSCHWWASRILGAECNP